MYKDIMESIENLDFSEKANKMILMENCLKHIFSLKPFGIKNTEYHKRFVDWIKLRNNEHLVHDEDISKLKKEMRSYFYRTEFGNKKIAEGDITLLIQKFTSDDLKIALAMKAFNIQVWHYRLSGLWAIILAVVSLIIAVISIQTGQG